MLLIYVMPLNFTVILSFIKLKFNLEPLPLRNRVVTTYTYKVLLYYSAKIQCFELFNFCLFFKSIFNSH